MWMNMYYHAGLEENTAGIRECFPYVVQMTFLKYVFIDSFKEREREIEGEKERYIYVIGKHQFSCF